MRDSRIALLRGVWLFERCNRRELGLLARTATAVRAPAGKVLAREGDIGREFFVLVGGTVEATRNGVRIATLTTGDFFGEMALLDREPRAATVTAVEDTDLLVLTCRQFLSVLETMPSVDRKIITVLAKRLREIEDRFLPEEQHIDLAAAHLLAAERSRPRSPSRSSAGVPH